MDTKGSAIGAALKKRRLERGLSLRDVADKAGISSTEVFRIERGDRIRSSTPILFAVGAALGISNDEMLRLAGYKPDDSISSIEKAFPDMKTEKQQETVRRIVDSLAKRHALQDGDYDDLVKQMEMFLDYAEKKRNIEDLANMKT